MRRLVWLVAVVFAIGVVPARADDGGFWDFLQKQSGPKMAGFGSDFHLLCLTETKENVPCERFFGLKRVPMNYNTVKHEVDLRVAHYWSHGSRFSDTPDFRAVRAVKLMGMYHYHVTPIVHVGAGVGLMPYYGTGFDAFAIPIVTPASVIVAPFRYSALKGITLRVEESYLAGALNGHKYGNAVTNYNVPNGEWNFSFGLGYDFRFVR